MNLRIFICKDLKYFIGSISKYALTSFSILYVKLHEMQNKIYREMLNLQITKEIFKFNINKSLNTYLDRMEAKTFL